MKIPNGEIRIEYKVENSIKYRIIYFDLITDIVNIPEDDFKTLLMEYEWNQIFVISPNRFRGPFYTRYDKGHNEFGPAIVDDEKKVYMIEDQEMSYDDFLKYTRKKKLQKLNTQSSE